MSLFLHITSFPVRLYNEQEMKYKKDDNSIPDHVAGLDSALHGHCAVREGTVLCALLTGNIIKINQKLISGREHNR